MLIPDRIHIALKDLSISKFPENTQFELWEFNLLNNHRFYHGNLQSVKYETYFMTYHALNLLSNAYELNSEVAFDLDSRSSL